MSHFGVFVRCAALIGWLACLAASGVLGLVNIFTYNVGGLLACLVASGVLRAAGVLGSEWRRWAVGGLLACLGMLGSGRATGVIGGQRGSGGVC